MLVSVVLPAYNEADKLENAVTQISQALKKTGYTYEIVIAEDGSTDGTAERSEELTEKYPYVRHIHREKRQGRGVALNNAFPVLQRGSFCLHGFRFGHQFEILKATY